MRARRTRAGLVAVLATIVAVGGCGSADRTNDVEALVDIGAGLQGPNAVQANVYATGLVHASAFAFDAQGRLWVATAAFSDDGSDVVAMVPQPGATPVTVLTDAHTPLGLLWLGDELYVASKGGVDAYATFDGSSFATHRTVVALATDVGEVNGLALAPDGRVLLGVSAPCDHCVPTDPDSGAILSFRPDGTDLRVYASGIRAPIALVFRPDTAELYVTMNHRDDLGDATPGDWLALVAEGQNWGFPDCWGQGGAACVDVPQPVAALDPHAALSGLAIVTAQLGTALADQAIVAEWGSGLVKAVPLDPGDAATRGNSTLVTGMTNPMPVVVGATGVFVADWSTGIVYELTAASPR
jgi:glucose/arabinose dehydrogenase